MCNKVHQVSGPEYLLNKSHRMELGNDHGNAAYPDYSKVGYTYSGRVFIEGRSRDRFNPSQAHPEPSQAVQETT